MSFWSVLVGIIVYIFLHRVVASVLNGPIAGSAAYAAAARIAIAGLLAAAVVAAGVAALSTIRKR